MKAGKVTDFMKAHDCDSTYDELKEFVAEKAAQDRPIELSEDELEKVVGGVSESGQADYEVLKLFLDLFSLFSLFTATPSNNVSD